jgi:hypothetical protein
MAIPAHVQPAPGPGVGVIFPSGMLGAGFTAESVKRGIAMGATAIAIDGGSTDSGPHYLGAGVSKSAASAVERDLRILLTAACENAIPLIVGSCGTSGTDAGVDWVADIAVRIAEQERLSFRMARIYSEVEPAALIDAIGLGRVRGLPPQGGLSPDTVTSCEHIVALLGHEPIVAALRAGAQVVLTGRATDTSTVAAVALMHGLPAGPAWHAAKTVECGGQCTTSPTAGGVFVRVDEGGFTVTPLSLEAACTPTSVAAHMMYENADPFRLVEPTGTLDTADATYTALDERSVRVEGSRFEQSTRPTAKLEGARLAGYETLALVGIRDPHILASLDTWLAYLRTVLADRVSSALRLDPGQYSVALRSYGADAVLGPLEDTAGPPREIGLLFKVRAATQELATAVAKTANPLLLHLPLPGMDYLPSFAFATSPAEIERGASYEFVLNHVLELGHGSDPFRTVLSEVVHA